MVALFVYNGLSAFEDIAKCSFAKLIFPCIHLIYFRAGASHSIIRFLKGRPIAA